MQTTLKRDRLQRCRIALAGKHTPPHSKIPHLPMMKFENWLIWDDQGLKMLVTYTQITCKRNEDQHYRNALARKALVSTKLETQRSPIAIRYEIRS